MSLRIKHHVCVVVLVLLCVRCLSLGHHIDLRIRHVPFGNGWNFNKTLLLYDKRVVAIDVSHGVLMGGSIIFDIITFGKVRSKGALCWFYSKGGMFGIPRVQVPLGTYFLLTLPNVMTSNVMEPPMSTPCETLIGTIPIDIQRKSLLKFHPFPKGTHLLIKSIWCPKEKHITHKGIKTITQTWCSILKDITNFQDDNNLKWYKDWTSLIQK